MPAATEVDTEPVRLGALGETHKALVSPGALDRPDVASVWAPSVMVTKMGCHLLYRSGDRASLVVDGQEWPAEEVMTQMGGLAVSGDGQHIAYACDGGVVRDGEKLETDGYVQVVILSPDGARLAWTESLFAEGAEAGREVMVVDGERELTFTHLMDALLTARFSPDGSRFAYVGQRGDWGEDDEAYVLVADGRESPEYDRILFSGPLFSPDSEHLAYAAVQGDTVKILLDEQVIYDYSAADVESAYATCMTAPQMTMSMPMAFSADSERLAFFDQSPQQQAVVLDGQRGESWDTVGCHDHWPIPALMLPLEPPAFHPDGHSVAFIGTRDDVSYLVSQGRIEREYELGSEDHRHFVTGGPWWTSDGEHLVAIVAVAEPAPERTEAPDAVAPPDDKPSLPVLPERLVVDGEVRAKTDGITAGPYFGAGGSIVFSARSRDGYICVVDGREGRPYDAIGAELGQDPRWAGPVLSPDMRHVAYLALRDGAWRVVVDSREGPQFENIIGPTRRWEPYPVPVATYARLEASGEWVETDDVAGECTQLEGGEPIWSPDSEMVACAGRDDVGWHVVAGQHIGEACDFIFPESIRWLQPGVVQYICVREGEFWRLTEDLR
ncbi:MAG: hypothetical protein U9R79_15945 [Armatimonadota bacterium]|nr:hypothetical protein [Armatimonadota bacterium]